MLFYYFSKLGPITHVDWIEEVIPVFGKILITQTDISTEYKSTCPKLAVFTIGCTGIILTLVTIKKFKHKKDFEKKEVIRDKEKVSNNYEKQQIEINDTFTDDSNTFNLCPLKQNKEGDKGIETIEIEKDIHETELSNVTDNILKEKIEVSFEDGTVSLNSNQEYSVQLDNMKHMKNNISERKENSKKQWCYYQEFELEDVEWIRKIKTFKITKVQSKKLAKRSDCK